MFACCLAVQNFINTVPAHMTNLQGGKIALWGLGVASDLTRDLGIGVASELTRIWGFGMASKLTQDLVEVTHKLIHLLYYSLRKT